MQRTRQDVKSALLVGLYSIQTRWTDQQRLSRHVALSGIGPFGINFRDINRSGVPLGSGKIHLTSGDSDWLNRDSHMWYNIQPQRRHSSFNHHLNL